MISAYDYCHLATLSHISYNIKTTNVWSEEHLVSCYNMMFFWEPLGPDVLVDVILVRTTHLNTTFDWAHLPLATDSLTQSTDLLAV